jgi:hypothetical protein
MIVTVLYISLAFMFISWKSKSFCAKYAFFNKKGVRDGLGMLQAWIKLAIYKIF